MGTFLAKPLHEMKLLTLPDAFARIYGEAAEILCSLVTMISFIFLLAGNLVGCGKVTSYLFGMDEYVGIILATALIWMYSCAGGLLSVAYTDVIQAAIGWTGFVAATAWIRGNMPSAAGVSVAYPVGDMPVIGAGLTDPDSYDPIPNAIFFNWATVIVLAFGNCMALDFNARCFSAKSARTAQISCLIAGVIAGAVGVFNTWNAGTMRALYGPSSPHAEFVANSCSADITVIGCFGGAAADPSLNKTCNAPWLGWSLVCWTFDSGRAPPGCAHLRRVEARPLCCPEAWVNCTMPREAEEDVDVHQARVPWLRGLARHCWLSGGSRGEFPYEWRPWYLAPWRCFP